MRVRREERVELAPNVFAIKLQFFGHRFCLLLPIFFNVVPNVGIMKRMKPWIIIVTN